VSHLPLAGIRVVELADGIAGPYAGKLLAELGAQVVKVEPPAGDTSRRLGPFWQGEPHPDRSGLYLYLNAGKTGIVLDLALDAGRRACLDLLATADVCIENFGPGEIERLGLGVSVLRTARPSLVVVSVTAFGQWGPRAGWRGNDLIAAHSSGFAHGFPAVQVDRPELAPLNTPTYAAEFLAGQTAGVAALHGLLLAQRTGEGGHLDVSQQEAVAAANNSQFNTLQTAGTRDTPQAPLETPRTAGTRDTQRAQLETPRTAGMQAETRRSGGPRPSRRVFSEKPSNATVALLPCADGWIAISPREEHQWARWLDVMGSPAWGADPRFADRLLRERHWGQVYPLLAEWTRSRSKQAIFEAAQARRVACYPLASATDLLASAQLKERNFFVDLDDRQLPGVVLPGRPYHLDGVKPSPPTRAPHLGEHTAQILAALKSGPRPPDPVENSATPPTPPSSANLPEGPSRAVATSATPPRPNVSEASPGCPVALRDETLTGSPSVAPTAARSEILPRYSSDTFPSVAPTTPRDETLTGHAPDTSRDVGPGALRPLEGVRVIDFSWVLTGPICTKYLAALGAEVIKIESAARADLSQRTPAWEELNPGKRSVTLNLTRPRARELARDLIEHSHVVVENFSTGVMERLGLDYQTLKAINPGVIMASSSALGRSGPERDRVAYGTLIQCFTGWAGLSAHPGAPPRSAGGVWTDPLTAAFETVLILAAIFRQRTTGEGGFYDLSMAETTIAALPEPILAWCLNQMVLEPRGNRHPIDAPQGCYPAAGDDRWVALSIQADAEWATLCRLMQRDDLLADERLATVDGRRQHHDAIDQAIAAWTAMRPADETAAGLLQAHGIAATATREPSELVDDVHLAARSFVSPLERLDGSVRPVAGVPWLIDRQRPNAFRRAPRLGEDNVYVFGDLLGLGPAEYDRLVAEQVIY
jgi:crotonobetainyl-CoA:carnitine CoA-transferase CaiB-like acyl-CoA transferase